MNQNRKGLMAATILLALIAIMLWIWSLGGPAPQEGTKAYTLEVVDDAGASKTYEGKTDAEYLHGLMDELQASQDFTYVGEDGQYGLFIQTVNGVTADYSADGAYWAIYVNGEYGQYGADEQTVSDGDAFRLVYEK